MFWMTFRVVCAEFKPETAYNEHLHNTYPYGKSLKNQHQITPLSSWLCDKDWAFFMWSCTKHRQKNLEEPTCSVTFSRADSACVSAMSKRHVSLLKIHYGHLWIWHVCLLITVLHLHNCPFTFNRSALWINVELCAFLFGFFFFLDELQQQLSTMSSTASPWVLCHRRFELKLNGSSLIQKINHSHSHSLLFGFILSAQKSQSHPVSFQPDSWCSLQVSGHDICSHEIQLLQFLTQCKSFLKHSSLNGFLVFPGCRKRNASIKRRFFEILCVKT